MATRAAAMDLGVSEFVTKPVNNHDLLTRVRTQLSNLEWNRTAEQVVSQIEKTAVLAANKH
jgi:PleD family two-component response regulator